MARKKKGRIDRSETFDEFLTSDGLLAETEDAALRQIAYQDGEIGRLRVIRDFLPPPESLALRRNKKGKSVKREV